MAKRFPRRYSELYFSAVESGIFDSAKAWRMEPVIVSIRRLAAALAFVLLCSVYSAAQPVPIAQEWRLETIKLKNGYVLKGLVLEETAAGVRFQLVNRSNGRPTVCMTSTLRRGDIDRIEKLPEEEREALKNRLNELDPTGEGERKRMESLELQVTDWDGQAKAGRRYDSDYFSLLSNAPEAVVRRSAVRLEQIYTAYAHFLPARYPGGKPTTIVLYPSLDDYQKMLDGKGWKLQNRAFFHPDSNRVFCGSNLLKVGEDLEKIRLMHQEQRGDLDKRESLLRQLYGKKPLELARHLQPILEYRKNMAKADKHNDAIFDNETKRLFTILYHEAFHAYACNFVYPSSGRDSHPESPPGELPRWLNEGLAQIFETAIVESGELRVGHVDRERILKVKEAIRKGEMMPVKELLTAGRNAFIVQISDERLTSDRSYLASWALTSYLTFDRRLLGTPSLDAFVRAVNREGEPKEAFCKLTGQRITEFEKSFHVWLLKLPTEGSMLEPSSIKEK